MLYSFTGGTDGKQPFADLTFDGAGNLYGTTAYGGSFGVNCGSPGCGVVFKLTPNKDGNWTESVLYSFTGGADGKSPSAGLVFDVAGNLYGTTLRGGNCGGDGCGVVFKLVPKSDGSWTESVKSDGSWTESVLHVFQGRPAADPERGSLVLDKAGNLYGTTTNCILGLGCVGGVVYEVTP